MSRMISQHGWELDLRVQAVFGRWAELVGDEVASHCTPESLAETRLIVRTDSTAWATQLPRCCCLALRRGHPRLASPMPLPNVFHRFSSKSFGPLFWQNSDKMPKQRTSRHLTWKQRSTISA